MKLISLLIPTYNRPDALAVTLTGLAFQNEKSFDVIISDQSEEGLLSGHASLQTAIRLLEMRGHKVEVLRNMPFRGMAQQRQFLLEHSKSAFSLYLDDDLLLEPYVLGNLKRVIEEEEVGFAGSAVIGLSYLNDIRPDQQRIEFWEEKVLPETILPFTEQWNRYKLHNAANILHVQEKFKIRQEEPRKYKVAWIGGCVMYHTEKLLDVGGFEFWKSLPEKHCGEDVLAQLRVMKKYGGCGVLPSGVYHQELETTIPDRRLNAPEYLEI